MSNYSHFYSHFDMSDMDRKRPRKTPAQARSRATFDAVLTASAHILEAHGLAGFNTNAVAERAGVSIGSLYQYFPSKDAILAALIERRAVTFAEEVLAAAGAARGETLADDLRLMLSHAIDWHSQSSALTRILDDEVRRLGRSLDLEPVDARFQVSLATVLQRHVAGDMKDLPRVARDMSMIIKALMQNEGERQTPNWRRAIEGAVGAVLGYLASAVPKTANRLTQHGRAA